MGWGDSFTRKLRKASKVVTDTTTKVAHDAVNEVTDRTSDPHKLSQDAEKAASVAVSTAVHEADKALGDSLKWLEHSANGFSDAAQEYANEAEKRLRQVGDQAAAIGDAIFRNSFEALIDQIADDFDNFIDETFDIIEDIPSEAARKLAEIQAGIHSQSDLTNAFKEVVVAWSRLTPGLVAHTALTNATNYFKSVSWGVYGGAASGNKGFGADAGLASDAGQLTQAYIFKRDAKNVDMALYGGYARSIGTSTGTDIGVELASWVDRPGDLAGGFLGAAISVKALAGASVQVFVADDLSKFLGINIAISASNDPGADFDIFRGKTYTYPF